MPKPTKQTKPEKAKDVHTELAQELDGMLLKILKEGQVIQNPETGEPMTISPTAAMLGVVRGRLKDLNVGGLALPESQTAQLLSTAKVLKLAPISDMEDERDEGIAKAS